MSTDAQVALTTAAQISKDKDPEAVLDLARNLLSFLTAAPPALPASPPPPGQDPASLLGTVPLSVPDPDQPEVTPSGQPTAQVPPPQTAPEDVDPDAQPDPEPVTP